MTSTSDEHATRDSTHDQINTARGLRLLVVLFATAVAVSIVHYVDNVAAYADYPVPTKGPVPSRELIAVAWFVFTAFGIAGLILFVRRRITAAAFCLTVYSVSGLVGFAHYAAPGAFDMPWWRQTHIVADILCGIAIFAFAIRSVLVSRRPSAAGSQR